MRLLRLVAGLLVIALAVGAQDPAAADYYDYYDDAAADGSPLDASAVGSDQGAVVPAKEGEEALSDDPVTEPVVTTTTAAPTTEGRRKLVSLKSAKISRTRGEARQTTATPAPEGSPVVAPEVESASGGRRPGGSSSVRGGLQRTRSNSRLASSQQDAEAATEASSGPTRSRFRPSARSEPAAASTDDTQGSSNRFQPRRSSFRPSSSSSNNDAQAEESSDKAAPSNRFRPSSRSSFRPSSTRASTETTTPSTGEETASPHRFGTTRRGRGNSRGGSAFQPGRGRAEQSTTAPEEVVEGEEEAAASDPSRLSNRRISGRKFRGPPIIRKAPHVSRPQGIPDISQAPTTTAPTSTTPATTTTTKSTTTETTTVSVVGLQESTTEPVAVEEHTEPQVKSEDLATVEGAEGDMTMMDKINMADMINMEDMGAKDEMVPVKDMTELEEKPGAMNTEDIVKMDMTEKEDMLMFEKRTGVEDVTEKAELSQTDEAFTQMDEMPVQDEVFPNDEVPVNDHQPEPEPVVLRPLVVRRTTTEVVTEIATEPTLARTEPPVTRSSRRGSSRYSPPKPPSHPIVETTQAPAPSSVNIFAPPLSDAVKSRSRDNSRPRVRAPSSRESNANTVTNGPTEIIEETVDIDEEPSSNRFRQPNYGASDIQFQGGEVKITEIGTVEDTPVEEVRQILGGLGSRRRGLGRPQKNYNAAQQKAKVVKTTTTTEKPNLQVDDYYDYHYDY